VGDPVSGAERRRSRFWRRTAERVAHDGVREERRPVPGKPHIPHDVWITVKVG